MYTICFAKNLDILVLYYPIFYLNNHHLLAPALKGTLSSQTGKEFDLSVQCSSEDAKPSRQKPLAARPSLPCVRPNLTVVVTAQLNLNMSWRLT
jgi:hypothetical protein